jgi:hypothetical protein
MGPELKHVADSGDCDRVALGRERAALDALIWIEKENLVDLVGGETGNLDGGVVQNEFAKFDLEGREVPFAFFSEPINSTESRTDFADSPSVRV